MINGIINVYKEKGYTSHDVVAKLRGILKQRKIGHTGTLDPEAQGVLPVCLGKGTKLCDMLTQKDKTYEVVMLLGLSTDTQDITGEVIHRNEVKVEEEQIKKVIQGYIGEYNQIPPMYSALKVNGRKLYELARAGEVVERQAREVFIHNIYIHEININSKEIKMSVDCSKGTYIRTLCHDIGSDLLCGGCMKSLIRTKTGNFHISDSLKLSTIEELYKNNKIDEHVLKIDKMFSKYARVVVLKEFDKLIYNGNPFAKEHVSGYLECAASTDMVRVYDEKGLFIGLYKYFEEQKYFKPIKIFI